jgi:hypothetical protein
MAKASKPTKKEETPVVEETKGFQIDESNFLDDVDNEIELSNQGREIRISSDDRPSNPKYVTIRINATDAYYNEGEAVVVGTDPYKGNFALDMQLAGIKRGNKLKFLTGLEVEDYDEEWEKEFLMESLPILKREFGEEIMDPFNMEFWSTRSLLVNADEILLDLEKPDDLLTYWCIKGKGFPYIAGSPTIAKNRNVKFYLEEPNIEYETEDSFSKIKDKAIAKLAAIDDVKNSVTTLFFLHKALIDSSEGVTFNTPKDLIYQSLRDFIDGKYNSSGKKKKAPEQFLKAYDTWTNQPKVIKTKAIVNDCVHYGIIYTDKAGNLINGESNYNFGSRDKDLVSKELNKPTNQDELLLLYKAIKLKWHSY